MKVIPLRKSARIYSCNSYLILGDWNRIGDVNTLVDPGTDDFVSAEIEQMSTGLGKNRVDQIILTHGHFDHAAGVLPLKKRFGARVLAFADGPGVDGLLRDGQLVPCGDETLEIVHTPGHSSDSICLYAPASRTLFSGDTQLQVRSRGDYYTGEYLTGLAKIAGKRIDRIYSGHDAPVTGQARAMIMTTLCNVRNSRLAATGPEVTGSRAVG